MNIFGINGKIAGRWPTRKRYRGGVRSACHCHLAMTCTAPRHAPTHLIQNKRIPCTAGICFLKLGFHATHALTRHRGTMHLHADTVPTQTLKGCNGNRQGRHIRDNSIYIRTYRGNGSTLLFQELQNALYSKRPANRRSGLATNLLDKIVIASPPQMVPCEPNWSVTNSNTVRL